MILNNFSTFIFYMLLIFSSLFLVLATNSIYSLFFFLLIIITSIIFILFNVDFIRILLLLIYVGAIAVKILILILTVFYFLFFFNFLNQTIWFQDINVWVLLISFFIPICILFNVEISNCKLKLIIYLLILLVIELLLFFLFFNNDILILYLLFEISSLLIYLFSIWNDLQKKLLINFIILFLLLMSLIFLFSIQLGLTLSPTWVDSNYFSKLIFFFIICLKLFSLVYFFSFRVNRFTVFKNKVISLNLNVRKLLALNLIFLWFCFLLFLSSNTIYILSSMHLIFFNFSHWFVFISVNSLLFYFFYLEWDGFNAGYFYSVLKFYFLLYLLFYLNLNLYLIQLNFLNCLILINLDYYFNLMIDLFHFTDCDWVELSTVDNLKFTGLDISAMKVSNPETTTTIPNTGLSAKLNGVHSLDKELKLTGDEKTLVTTMHSFQQLSNQRGSGYVFIPSMRFENNCPVPFDVAIVNEAGLKAYQGNNKIITDTETLADFFKNYVTFYESKVLVNGVIQLNAIDLLLSQLKYFQSQLVYTNHNELIPETDFKNSINFVNSLNSEKKENYLDTRSIQLEQVSWQQAKLLVKKKKLSIDINSLNDFTLFKHWLQQNDSFFSEVNLNKLAQINNFKTNYFLNKSPTLFQQKTDCWRDLLSSDPKESKSVAKNIMGFNNHNILYNGYQPNLKVVDYSKFIHTKKNELKTIDYTDFLNQYEFSNDFKTKFVEQLQNGIRIYLKNYLR